MATTRHRKLKLYQVQVRLKGSMVHASEDDSETRGRARVKSQALKAGVGARGVLYRVDRKHDDTLVPIYEVRVAHSGKRGTAAIVAEDHTTPPVLPEA